MFTEDTIGDIVSSVRGWLVGEHAWPEEESATVLQERGAPSACREATDPFVYGPMEPLREEG